MLNYQLLLDKELESIIKSNKVPTLLLHACCAPCSSYVLEYLSKYFKVTILYYNPNITDKNEYFKRLNEIQNFIKKINYTNSVDIMDVEYNPDEYFNIVKGLEKDKEGGIRCYKCYEMRMDKTALIAKLNNYDYFTTTLSISPYKNSKWINEIGEHLQDKYNIKYLYADFKKRNGYKKSIELSKEYNLYRQNYCGCIYSKR